ncbi:hypothetical protein ABKV19_017148 [Rosa sericea]
MELTELSLAPTISAESKNMNTSRRKRKLFEDDYLLMKINETSVVRTSHVDLELENPLPLDWEQCLDLKSGKVYYLNRKTSKKSWKRPLKEDQEEAHLDLELHISSTFSADDSCSEQRRCRRSSKKVTAEEVVIGSSNNNMTLALACLNCHLLVILSKSSPCCPNCKYVHSFPHYVNKLIRQQPRAVV